MADDLRNAASAPGLARDSAAARQVDDRRLANRRLAFILASIALVFFLGFIARIALYGPH